METDEDKLYKFLSTKQLKKVEVNHDLGTVYFYFEDDSKITIIGLEDNIVVAFD